MDLWNTLPPLEQIWIANSWAPGAERQCVHLCYGPSKRLNFVQFILFKHSTNFDYWKLYTSHSLPILKNAYCPLIFISGRLRYCSLYAKFFFLDCFQEYKFGAMRNYWIIKNKSSQIQWMLTEYNKSHIQDILKKNGKNTTLHNLYCFFWEVISKTCASGFIRFPIAWKQ